VTPSNLPSRELRGEAGPGPRPVSSPRLAEGLTLNQTVREPMAGTLLDIAAADFLSDENLIDLMILLDWIVSLPEVATA
jgi:hypothetical protein